MIKESEQELRAIMKRQAVTDQVRKKKHLHFPFERTWNATFSNLNFQDKFEILDARDKLFRLNGLDRLVAWDTDGGQRR